MCCTQRSHCPVHSPPGGGFGVSSVQWWGDSSCFTEEFSSGGRGAAHHSGVAARIAFLAAPERTLVLHRCELGQARRPGGRRLKVSGRTLHLCLWLCFLVHLFRTGKLHEWWSELAITVEARSPAPPARRMRSAKCIQSLG